MVDYPNSKKARKVFLCLFVGGGGGAQQVPKGLEGEEEEEGKVLFEKRRERMRMKGKEGKRKNIKDKDWILKKKEVGLMHSSKFCLHANNHSPLAIPPAGEGRRTPRFKIHRAQTEGSLLRHIPRLFYTRHGPVTI